jgi:hypothetical protein
MTVTSPAAAEPWWRRKFGELFGLDVRSLAVFRVGLGLLLLVDLIDRCRDLDAHYTDEGVLPRSLMEHPWPLSLHCLGGGAWLQAILFGVAACFAVALVVGWRTRLATAVSWFLLVSVQARNPVLLQGADVLFRLLLFWGMFLPLGACWSLDRRAGRGAAGPRQVVSGGSVALVLQLCFVYWFTALLKNDPSWWPEGTAVGYALSNGHFATPLGRWLLGFPDLLTVLTFGTLVLEAVGPLLLFVPVFNGPVRLAVVTGFVVFHLAGLGLCLELGLFPFVCALAWLALLPGWFWDRLPVPKPVAGAGASGKLGHGVAGLLLAYVFCWNVRTVDPDGLGRCFPERVNLLGGILFLDQTWNMFSPRPPAEHGWFVIEGRLKDGSVVDLFRDGAPLTWDKPPLVSATYKNEHWRKYMMNIGCPANEFLRPPLCRYLVRTWNARHPEEQAVLGVTVYCMRQETLPDFTLTPPEKHVLAEYSPAGELDTLHNPSYSSAR